MALTGGDRLALGAIEAALAQARESDDQRPALEVLAGSLIELGVSPTVGGHPARTLVRDRNLWLRRTQSAQRSQSTLNAYRLAIDDLLAWSERERQAAIDEQAIVEYLDDYQRRCHPAPATYYRRFVLLRRFVAWACRRNGVPDPFLDLPAPPKPRQAGTWLTHEEFAQMLAGAERPERNRPGLVQRDRLVLLALVFTGLRRSELIAVRWSRSPSRRDTHRCSCPAAREEGYDPNRSRRSSSQSSSAGRQSGSPRRRSPCSAAWPAGRCSRPRSHGSSPAQPAAALLKARHDPHAAPHRGDLASPGGRRCAARRRVPGARGPHTTVARYAHVASQEMHIAVQALANSSYAALDPARQDV
jgi:hypothetical protein